MNFTNRPELYKGWGYPVALRGIAESALAAYLIFKKKKWL